MQPIEVLTVTDLNLLTTYNYLYQSRAGYTGSRATRERSARCYLFSFDSRTKSNSGLPIPESFKTQLHTAQWNFVQMYGRQIIIVGLFELTVNNYEIHIICNYKASVSLATITEFYEQKNVFLSTLFNN